METRATPLNTNRIVSGMRATGKLHLGHYHGVLKNWEALQHDYDCFYFVADWHALTTHYEDPRVISDSVMGMVIDWLAAGVDPKMSHIFVQSLVPEHAELHLLLSMITPVGWLERIPTYKEQQQKLKGKDLSTYGFLGYPLLQAADVLLYKAGAVPVGEDQVSHVEIIRDIAKRFNHLYGRGFDFEARVEAALKQMGKKQANVFMDLRKQYREKGNADTLDTGRALVDAQGNISLADKERLFGYLEGTGQSILPEPQSVLTNASKLTGLDGQKMSKSYGNTLNLREAPDVVDKKVRTMPTDPARVKRTDPGEPEKCPVWGLHKVYSNEEEKTWVQEGCRSAGIGCIDCKKVLINNINKEQDLFRERAKPYEENTDLVRHIIMEGTEVARATARETLRDIRQAMGVVYKDL